MSGVSTAVALLEEGVERGLHPGAQLAVQRGSLVLADVAVGNVGVDSLLHWFSATKPLAAVAIGQLWERGALRLDDRVCHYIPEFSAEGKGDITLRHLLTHTGGFRSRLDLEWGDLSWEEAIGQVCAARKERRWSVGRKAGYHIASSWYALGEVVRRIDGRPYDQYVREEVFLPLGMDDCWLSMPEDRYRDYGQRMASIYATGQGSAIPQADRNGAEIAARCVPGASGRGPARQLVRLYEALMGEGQSRGKRVLSPQTVEALTARQRTGFYDHTFKHVMDWGLGLVVNSAMYGVETVPYGYGRHASWRTYGHSGQQCAVAFADPEAQLAVALIVNGMPGAERHHTRFFEVLSALYEDLDIVDGGASVA
jgi:CubicO group peptidase (beta-lactamase class C family)